MINPLKKIEYLLRDLGYFLGILDIKPLSESGEKLKMAIRANQVGSDLQRLNDLITLAKLEGSYLSLSYGDQDIYNVLLSQDETVVLPSGSTHHALCEYKGIWVYVDLDEIYKDWYITIQ